MRCCLSRLYREGRITQRQHETARQWNALARAYRALLSGAYDDGAGIVAGKANARLSGFERAVIRRYRALAPYLGPVERAIVEGRGRYPRGISELCAVRLALDEIGARWVEAG